MFALQWQSMTTEDNRIFIFSNILATQAPDSLLSSCPRTLHIVLWAHGWTARLSSARSAEVTPPGGHCRAGLQHHRDPSTGLQLLKPGTSPYPWEAQETRGHNFLFWNCESACKGNGAAATWILTLSCFIKHHATSSSLYVYFELSKNIRGPEVNYTSYNSSQKHTPSQNLYSNQAQPYRFVFKFFFKLDLNREYIYNYGAQFTKISAILTLGKEKYFHFENEFASELSY